MSKNFISHSGNPLPIGSSYDGKGVNFSLFSRSATTCTLGIFDPATKELIASFALDSKKNKTGDTWHIYIEGITLPILYGYKLSQPYLKPTEEKWLIDPRSRHLETSKEWKKPAQEPLLNRIENESHPLQFSPPNIAKEDLIIYEMHVRGFTADSSSHVKDPGTYLGVIEKIPYLQKLGINAVELMPIHEFHEWNHTMFHQYELVNYWGYSTVNFFCPMQRFAALAQGTAKEQFQKMVQAFHHAGIKVLIDVVYNHTAEAFDLGIWQSFCGIDRSSYYLLKGDLDENFTGCGNTLNCNHPEVQSLILDSLRYFATEMGIDGFRFDLTSILNRDEKGHLLDPAPLVAQIAEDPLLKDKILIAEPWDAAGAYQVGRFAHADPHWLEWNGIYRDNIRKFIRGDLGSKNHMAASFCGSEPTYGKTFPQSSINFITAHDGYSLKDLVSYERKHNLANHEFNRDGNNENFSWNCTIEGETSDLGIQGLRRRQMKNFFVSLLLSQGIPMLLMGDEYGHTRHGNNNPYPQDNSINWFQWNELTKNEGLFRFVSLLIQLRKEHPILRKTKFLRDKEILWHGKEPLKPAWDDPIPFLGCTLIDDKEHHLLIYFNATKDEIEIRLPSPPSQKSWHVIVDTFAEPPFDFRQKGTEKRINESSYRLSSYSSVVFKAL